MIKTKNPLFRRWSRLNELQVVDMALSELEQNTMISVHETAAFLRRVGGAMEGKLSQISYLTASDELFEITRGAFLFGTREGYSCVGDMLVALHRVRPLVEQRMAQQAAEAKTEQAETRTGHAEGSEESGKHVSESVSEVSKSGENASEGVKNAHGGGGKGKKRPFCERISKPLTMTVCILLVAGLIGGVGIILHYLYPNGLFLQSVEVPDLVGQNLNAAELDGKLFALQVTYQYNADSEVGTILSQSPQAGMVRRVSPGRHPCVLTLTVSLGAEQVQVGDYIGMTKYQALTACRRLGLIPNIKQVDGYPAGSVARTEPAAGEVLSAGSTVTLYVGTSHNVAKVAVPNLIGLSEISASTMLSSLGLTRGNVSYMTSDQPVGTVIAQSVLSGNSVSTGTRVSIVVSKGKTE